MWHSFLVIPPLLCFMIATWKLWEPERDPKFGWMLAGFGLQLVHLADKIITGAGGLAIGFAAFGALSLMYCLKRTIVVEQISKRIRERKEQE